jgi:hypothetical protein
MVPPAVPSGLTLYGTGTSLGLSWDANTEEDLAGYKVHNTLQGSGHTDSVRISNVRNYTIDNLEPGETYDVSLSAYDTSDNESVRSPSESYRVPQTAFTVSGMVVDLNANALPGITVALTDSDKTVKLKTESDAGGAYAFGDLPAGSYVLKGQSDSYGFKAVQVTIVDSDVTADLAGRAKGGKGGGKGGGK